MMVFAQEAMSDGEVAEIYTRLRRYDRPFRSFVISVDEPSPDHPGKRPMAFEAAKYPDGSVMLFDEIPGVGQPRRAIVLVLDESPKYPDQNAPLVDDPMSTPVKAGDLTFDLADASEMGDEGEYVWVGFHMKHRPPFLILTGERANDVRAADLPNNLDVPQYLSEPEMGELTGRLAEGKQLTVGEAQRLIADIANLRRSRDELLSQASGYISYSWESFEELARSVVEGRYRRIKCETSNSCQIRADGGCVCKNPDYLNGTIYKYR